MNRNADIQRSWITGGSIHPTRRTAAADVNGSGVNLGEATGAVSGILHVGNLSNSVLTLTMTLTESKNDNTADVQGAAEAYAAMSPAATTGTLTEPGIENTVTVLTTFARSRKYVRANIAHTGTVTAQQIYGVSIISPAKSY